MKLPHRKPLRLPEYDYSQPGAYFVTICTKGRECSLGYIQGEEMRFSLYGEIAAQGWDFTSNHFQRLELDWWVVMPNHVHALIVIQDSSKGSVLQPTPAVSIEATNLPIPPQSLLAKVVAHYKYHTTKKINLARNLSGERFWQRNYYEHVVRSHESMQKIQEYILANPMRWNEDQLNPSAPPNQFNQQ